MLASMLWKYVEFNVRDLFINRTVAGVKKCDLKT